MADQVQPSRDQLQIPGLESVLGSGLPPKLKFEAPGEVKSLRITDARPMRDTDFDTGKPLDWPSGQPKMVLVLIGDDDDGASWHFWVKGRRASDAFREAQAVAGVTGVARGDVVTITRGPDEELPPKKKGAKPVFANTWSMTIVPAGVA
jgi:hypothetical protein